MPLPNGCYLVFGPMHEPTVHVVTKEGQETYWSRMKIADGSERAMREVMRITFNAPDATYALPAWSQGCMETIAQEYEGPHKIAVRGIAAAIALGKPFSKDVNPDTDTGPKGGDKVPRNPKGPKPTSPAKLSAFDLLKSGV